MLFNFELKIQTDVIFTKYTYMKHLEYFSQVVKRGKETVGLRCKQ